MSEVDYLYEPDVFGRQVDEFKQSLMDSIVKEHRDEMTRLREENERLSAIEQDMLDTTIQYKAIRVEIERQKRHLKSEVESEFYAASIGEILQRYTDNSEVWYAAATPHDRPKCNLCNDARRQTALYPDGNETSKSCECATPILIFEPCISKLIRLTFHKRNSRYQSEQSFSFSNSYLPSNKDYRDYNYQDFVICHTVDMFSDDTKQLDSNLRYNEQIAFTSKTECQKYCDWLNSTQKSRS